jgi:hypothetical protein
MAYACGGGEVSELAGKARKAPACGGRFRKRAWRQRSGVNEAQTRSRRPA